MAKQRLAVLGGGLGSLSTLFHLTEDPGWEEKFEITLYQQGWRLGGKCASARDLKPGYGGRVLEHGLHLFGGFYNYSFAMLRRCYDALDRPHGHPNRHVWDAFTGLDAITLMDRKVDKDGSVAFEPWYLNFETVPGRPGEGVDPPTIPEMMVGMIKLLAALDPDLGSLNSLGDNGSENFLKKAYEGVFALVGRIVFVTAETVVEAAIVNLEAHYGSLEAQIPAFLQGNSIERIRTAIYLVQTILHGMVADDVLNQGFNHLDQWELTDWIRRHAEEVARRYKGGSDDAIAQATALAEGPIVRGSYDYVFGYADADIDKPAQGAGTALRGCLRLICGFKGHLFYSMRGGMGDAVIAPLYLELAKRGVKFEFFSRVERLSPDEGGIAAIEVAVQARPKDGPYRPLIDIRVPGWPDAPLPSWPSEPLWDQLEDGAQLELSGEDFEAPWSVAKSTRTLRRGDDFDAVVLGIPIGELRRICADLPAVEPRWGRMLNALKTTRTLALQLWFRRTNEDLGYDNPGRTMTGARQPFSCWADMTHLLSRELWADGDRPRSIAYFCGQMKGPAATNAEEAAAANAEVGEAARQWLTTESPGLWREACSPATSFGLEAETLFDPAGREGEERFLGQYWRANTTPSELYVQYVPGSLQARMRADESGFDNLFLCGDWTRNGLNAGAAESAVMSGVICARVLLGDPNPIAGEVDVGK
jgi:uncharacterized protein with NAD-binding domain and iron-sulfur cluster